MKTRNRKLQLLDTFYVFQVPTTTSLDPKDIIEEGTLLWIKRGVSAAVDAEGNHFGKCGWNTLAPMEISVKEGDRDLSLWRTRIQNAQERTVRKLVAERNNPGDKLFRLSVTHHRGKVIQKRSVDSTSFYYINTEAFCVNCHKPIPGYTELEINRNGKVAKELPFVPYPGAVPHKGKWLHEECSANPIEHTEETKTGTREPHTPLKSNNVDEIMKDILINQEKYSSEFARGATYIFHLMNRP